MCAHTVHAVHTISTQRGAGHSWGQALCPTGPCPAQEAQVLPAQAPRHEACPRSGQQLALASNTSTSGSRTRIWQTAFMPKYVKMHVFNEKKHFLIWDQIISLQQKLLSCWDVSNLMQPTVYGSQMWFITNWKSVDSCKEQGSGFCIIWFGSENKTKSKTNH